MEFWKHGMSVENEQLSIHSNKIQQQLEPVLTKFQDSELDKAIQHSN
jgi:hypothetical protein